FTPNSIDLHLAEPRLTAEHVFKGLFKPGLSNQIARIVAEILTLLELHLANFTEVAQQVRCQCAVGIGPYWFYFDEHARKVHAVLSEVGDLITWEVMLDWHGF